MTSRSIAPNYAKVLFNLNRNEEKLKQRLLDFESMMKILKDNPKLLAFLKAPQVSLSEKKEVLRNSLNGVFDLSFINFIFYLIERGRLINLSHIAGEFRLMVNEYLEIWEVDVVTAVPMDADSEAKLKQKLENDFHKKIKLNKRIDPQIIGGAILVIDNEMLDWSVTGRLKKLKENLMTSQAGVQ